MFASLKNYIIIIIYNIVHSGSTFRPVLQNLWRNTEQICVYLRILHTEKHTLYFFNNYYGSFGSLIIKTAKTQYSAKHFF